MIVCVALIFLLTVAGEAPSEDSPLVQVNQGALQGRYVQSRKGRSFAAFTGIPFAKPPIGDLRFKAPVPAEPWEGTLDASKFHEVCPQANPLTGDFSIFGSEDCLFLNVYTPQVT